MKKLKNGTASEEELKDGLRMAADALKEVMDVCDWARDDLGNSVGVKITDINAGVSSWTKAE